MTPHHNPLNQVEITRLAKMGLSADQIAARMGTYSSRIRSFCKYHDIEYVRPRSPWSAETEALARRHYSEGKSRHESAQLIGCSTKALTAKLHAMRVRTREGPKAVLAAILPHISAEPPSIAMIRLAQFDPVIRRALRTRLGLEPETEDA